MKKLLLILVLTLIPQYSYADPKPDIRLYITDNSKYFKNPDYVLLISYLRKVERYWTIYKGDYYIEIGDGPNKMPPGYMGWHWPSDKGPHAYIDALAFKQAKMDIYYGITHELAEMAVNPHLEFYDRYGNWVEICDRNLIMYYMKHVVAYFDKPKDWDI